MNLSYTKYFTTSIGLILALLLSMAAFAPAVEAQSPCGSTYTVRSGDTLFRIAQRCETTIDALLNANPQIVNRNLIRTGQVLQIPTEAPPTPDVPGDPQALLVPSSGPAGTEVEARISGFPANQEVSLALGVEGQPTLDPFTATTNAQGRVQTNVTIPTTAQPGERWMVTARGPEGIEATSNVFLVATGQENVTITPTSGPAGSELTVNASGFLPDATVNVGVGRAGAEPVTIQTAQTDGQGNLTTTIAVPDTAEPDSRWRVVVGTEGWRVTALSEVFTVTGDPVNGEPDDGDGFIVHTVQRGDWLSRIARQYNTTVSAILAANPEITNPNRISVGQQIRIPSTDAPTVTSVNIYLISVGDGGARGPEIGCADSIVPVEVQIEPTAAPLRASLEQLFAAQGDDYGLYNVFERSQLSVEGINIVEGEATIQLSGQLSIGGVCDTPRVEEQLERTARQFGTVDTVSVTLNNQPLSEVLRQ
jgi:LysM repeat protein